MQSSLPQNFGMLFTNTEFPLSRCKGGFLKLVTLSLPKIKTIRLPLPEINFNLLKLRKFYMVSYICYASKCNLKPCSHNIKLILQEAGECLGSFWSWDLTYAQDEKVFQGLVTVPQWLLEVSWDGALSWLQAGWSHEKQQSISTWQEQTCSVDWSSHDCK